MAVCYDSFGRSYYCNSTWNNWGRWVALVCLIVAALIFFFLLACISQRRRRMAGRRPYYGTGWTQKMPGGGLPPPYQPNYQQPYQPQNQYGNQNYPQGGYYGQNQSYFGGRSDVEMQPPQNVYNNSGSYAPPPGPPPSKVH